MLSTNKTKKEGLEIQKNHIGIDVGGSKIAIGVIDNSGYIIAQKSFETPINNDDFIALLKDALPPFIAQFSPVSIGIGVPGWVEDGVVVFAPNLPFLNEIPLKSIVESAFALPTFIANDANCAALCEHHFGSLKGFKAPLMLTLGTGIGGGFIAGGKIFEGGFGAALEVGHMTLVKGGKKCGCGRNGCFEAYASTSALISLFQNEYPNFEGEINGKTIFAKIRGGDDQGAALFNRYLGYLCDGVVSIANILNPDAIAIGGGISREGELLLTPIRTALLECGYMGRSKEIFITNAKFFNSAGIVGASLLGKEYFYV